MRLADQHLNVDEIELLAEEKEVSQELEHEIQQARAHAASCSICSQRINVYRAKGTDLSRLKAPAGKKKGPECPTVDLLVRLAGGVLPAGEHAQYITHAAQCDHCGPILREIVKDFSTPPTEAEEAYLSDLETNTDEWQHRLGDRIETLLPKGPSRNEIKNVHRQPFRFFNLPSWQYVTGGLALFGIIGLIIYQLSIFGTNNVDELIGQAYGEKRTIELRFSGARYGALRAQRGPLRDPSDRPLHLAEAEGIIASQLPKKPENVKLLQEHARVFLLEHVPDKAISELEIALKISPEEPSLLIDKATAIFEKAERDASSLGYGEALHLLDRSLQLNPNNAIALFNRAVIYEKIQAWDKAMEDWQAYLKLDPKGAWANEASDHLKETQEHLKEHERAISEPLELPDSFTQIVLNGNADDIAKLDRRIEEYQEIALSNWLPRAFGRSNPKETQTTVAALHALASILSVRHHDQWLGEVLRNTRRPSFAAAVTALGEALSKSASGDPENNVYDKAASAERNFDQAGNGPGKLRAQVEQVHALRRAQEGDLCLSLARQIEPNLKIVHYVWMRVQLEIDQCSCSMMMGKFDAARAYIADARMQAEANGYYSLHLRTIGISASVDTDEGNLGNAWQLDQEGLADYWREPYALPLRAQQFYDDLSYSAEHLMDWDLALILAQESAHFAALARDQRLEARVRRHLARLALECGNTALAKRELQNSLLLNDLYSEIELAAIAMQEGDLHQAEEKLAPILHKKEELARSFTVARNFYQTYGKLLFKERRIEEAEDMLLAGIDIVDSKRRGISKTPSLYSWSQENADLYQTLVALELEKRDGERALSVWEWYRASLLPKDEFKEGLKSYLDNHRIRPQLAQLTGQTVLAYAILPHEGLAVWQFDDRGIRYCLLRLNLDDLSRQAAEFLKMTADQDSDLDHLKIKARGMFEILVTPVADRLENTRTLVVELDDSIGSLPFQAMLTRQQQYLGEVYRIVFSPGLFYDRYLRSMPPISAQDSALIVGSTANVVNENVYLDPPIDVEKEARSVVRRFPHKTLLVNFEATLQNLEASLPAADVFHFVGHALAAGRQEGLLLYDSLGEGQLGTSLWGAQQAHRNFFKNLKLAVLAACSTATVYGPRREVHGELVRAMLLAGVPHVIASRWNVDSKKTAEFMDVFYNVLRSGQSVASSLQVAESTIRARNPHPYFWAAFGAFGRT